VKRLNFLFFDAGGGHRAAANALRDTMQRQGLPFEIELINLQEILDELDIFRKLTGLRMQDIYNLLLKKGWTLGAAQILAGMHVIIRIFNRPTVRKLEALWRKTRPDILVSFIPNFNRAIFQSLARALPGVPMVTVITDFADYPPHFWLEPQDQFAVCGTPRAAGQALSMGLRKDNVFLVSGMVLNPRFYEIAPLSPAERAAARARLGLDPNQPVGLVLFGGQGAAVMADIARNLPHRQLILICGKNEKLAARLRAMQRPAPAFVEGFTNDVPSYMQLADYFIGKPGPGSISEAMAMHLPVIVQRNAWTLPQERYNAEWVIENGTGIVLSSFNGIAQAVDRLLEPAAYANYRAATERQHNRAVFEIPGILEKILQEITPLRTA
jgi:1,2-diacylglycerol 3-beta-galactosyltransferase